MLWISGAVAVVIIVAFVGAAVWIRRLDRDEFEQGGRRYLTDEERRALQLGIGLSGSNSQLGGH